MPLPILLLQGFDTVGVGWYADELKKCQLYDENGTEVEVLDFEYGKSKLKRKEIVAAICSGVYPAIIVADLSNDDVFMKFKKHLGLPLLEYVARGGRVAFPTSDAMMLLQVLKPLFGVQWEFAACHRINWRVPDGRAAAVDKMFPLNELDSEKKLASEAEFSQKACSYKNVPPEEQIFGNTGEGHSFIQGLDFLHKAGPDEPEGMWMYSVAVRKHGQGSIAFFGDVNCVSETCDLVAAYCLGSE